MSEEKKLEDENLFNNDIETLPNNNRNEGFEYCKGLFIGLLFGIFAYCFCLDRNKSTKYRKGLTNGLYINLLVILIIVSIIIYLYSKKLSEENGIYQKEDKDFRILNQLNKNSKENLKFN